MPVSVLKPRPNRHLIFLKTSGSQQILRICYTVQHSENFSTRAGTEILHRFQSLFSHQAIPAQIGHARTAICFEQ
jgi:hypothetical protein